jgi:CheY-like chemotaxis protein
VSSEKLGWRARTAALLGLNVDGEPTPSPAATTHYETPEDVTTVPGAHPPAWELDYILVVEDNPIVRRLLEDAITYAGYRVEAASNGGPALRRVMLSRPRLLVTDLEMPAMDGIELIRALRSDPRFADIPAILYTGSDRDHHLLARLSQLPGVVHVMTKGNVTELLRAITSLVPNESFPGVLRAVGDT